MGVWWLGVGVGIVAAGRAALHAQSLAAVVTMGREVARDAARRDGVEGTGCADAGAGCGHL